MAGPVRARRWSPPRQQKPVVRSSLRVSFTGEYTFLIAPGTRWQQDRDTTFSGTWRRVISPRAVNEFKASYLHLKRDSA
mgnify:CR=1 FL=1